MDRRILAVGILGCLLVGHLSAAETAQQQVVPDQAEPPVYSWPWPPASDPLGNVQKLADALYNHNDLSAVDAYCVANVVVHGDGVWLPRTAFVGTSWVKSIHAEWFAAYTEWHFNFFELTATQAVKGFTEVFGFFVWQAKNTGSYHGLTPTQRQSRAYGILHATTDKSGNITDVAIWRGGFLEERDVLLKDASTSDVISPLRDITDQPFWVPSQSLQLKMMTRAHALLEVLNQGEKFLDSLDDLALQTMVFIDGMDVWGPTKAVGLTDFKLWMAGWLQQYEVSAAVTGTAATAYSNKVFLSFKMFLTETEGGRTSSIDGCLMYVFNIQGFITHMVMFRNGTPKEAQQKFITGTAPRPGPVKLALQAAALSQPAGGDCLDSAEPRAQTHTQPLQMLLGQQEGGVMQQKPAQPPCAGHCARAGLPDGSAQQGNMHHVHSCLKQQSWRCWWLPWQRVAGQLEGVKA